MTIAFIVLSVALSLATVGLHEMGHALAMRRFGVPIEKAGIGLGFRPMLTIPPRGRRTWSFTISPWLVAAYVQASDKDFREKLTRLPYRDAAWYLGAGVVANVMAGAVLLAAGSMIEGRWARALIELAAGGLVWLGRRPFCSYVLPLASLAIAPLLLYLQFSASPSTGGLQGWGPIYDVNTLALAVVTAGAFSVSVALVNMAPFFGLDGGQIMARLVGKLFGERAQVRYSAVSLGLIAMLLAGMLIDTVLAA